MTHEFKTPISSIKIAADVLQKDTSITENSRLSRYANIIKEQNNRLNEQVEKVLNVARLEKETLKLNQDEIELNELVRSIVESNQIKLDNGKIEFEEKVSNIKIKADKLHLTNVIYNILDNAVKYCEKVPDIKVELFQDEKNLHLKFVDNGIGIPKESFKFLFDKFYRVNTGNVHNVKGFGLGLYYVKSICRAHGWDIWVDSEIGKGTSFDIIIPLQNKV
jgi:two-component system phosphate regulon sensor histidine kinase PhoR